MIGRCYNQNVPEYVNYGGLGVTVCERWLNYSNFLVDAVQLPGYQDMINNPNDVYSLDKDILQQGIPTCYKVYSPTTCCWVKTVTNAIQSIIDHKHEKTSKYYGVYRTNNGTYKAEICLDNPKRKIALGCYTNEDAAGAIFNMYARIYGYTNFHNDVPDITLQEAATYLTKKNIMCRDINKHFIGIRAGTKEGTYRATISCKNKDVNLGTFDDLVAAVNYRNYYCQFWPSSRLNTNIPYMSLEECIIHMLSNHDEIYNNFMQFINAEN